MIEFSYVKQTPIPNVLEPYKDQLTIWLNPYHRHLGRRLTDTGRMTVNSLEGEFACMKSYRST